SAKLGGFGAARAWPPDTAPAADRPLFGNPLYSAPEQFRGGAPSPRSDVYSLGALLYHLLTGRPRFTAELPEAVLYRKATADPTPPSRLRAGLPAGVDEVVGRLIAREPADRPADMAAARDALRRVAAPTPVPGVGPRDEVLLRYPSPITLAYSRVWKDRDLDGRVDRLFELAEEVVKYCAVVGLMASGEARGPAAPHRLDRLHSPAFGKWVEYLRAAVELARGASAVVDRLRDTFYGPRPGGGNGFDLVDGLVRGRIDLRHGRGRSAGGYDDWLARAHDLLDAVRWLAGLPPVRVEEIDFQEDTGGFLVRYRLCAGLVPVAGDGQQVLLDRPVKTGRVGVLDPAAPAFLDLAPFARYARCPVCDGEDVFIYNQMVADRRLLMVGGHGPHPLEDESADDLFARRGIAW
ncbi:MAG: hypothetical protein K2X87_11405, partial [Gemmataceae bacterium]|nr:hypothetical protein [Gemmataceae bacterium]